MPQLILARLEIGDISRVVVAPLLLFPRRGRGRAAAASPRGPQQHHQRALRRAGAPGAHKAGLLGGRSGLRGAAAVGLRGGDPSFLFFFAGGGGVRGGGGFFSQPFLLLNSFFLGGGGF